MVSNTRKIGIITQARTSSTRMPRKVMLEVHEKSILQHHVDRLQSSGFPVFIATTIEKSDDMIAALAKKIDVQFYRGSELDVLSRFYECAKSFNLDVIVRVTSDCPLIDGKLIKEGIQKYLLSPENTYASNCIERTYPRGFDFEIFSFAALEMAQLTANESFEREHVTPFVRDPKKNPGVNFLHLKRSVDASNYRITLDEQDDWTLIRKLIVDYDALSKSCEEIIQVLDKNPALSQINAHIEQKKI